MQLYIFIGYSVTLKHVYATYTDQFGKVNVSAAFHHFRFGGSGILTEYQCLVKTEPPFSVEHWNPFTQAVRSLAPASRHVPLPARCPASESLSLEHFP